jgi:hypothetical protein
VDKADPCGFAAEIRPRTASRVCDLNTCCWRDQDWIASRAKKNSLASPISFTKRIWDPGGASRKKEIDGARIGKWPNAGTSARLQGDSALAIES